MPRKSAPIRFDENCSAFLQTPIPHLLPDTKSIEDHNQ